jgi:hypothetical protein
MATSALVAPASPDDTLPATSGVFVACDPSWLEGVSGAAVRGASTSPTAGATRTPVRTNPDPLPAAAAAPLPSVPGRARHPVALTTSREVVDSGDCADAVAPLASSAQMPMV